jgi:low affinity Fe/Cu permease
LDSPKAIRVVIKSRAAIYGVVMVSKTKHRNNKPKTAATVARSSAGARKPFAAPTARPGWFERFARATALLAGRPMTFGAAVLIVAIWAVTGPIFHYSDTWQLVINTGTTIVTFLMVFLIQQSQNRDTMAVQIKLAELIIAGEAAHNALATAEDLSEQELTLLHQSFCKKAAATLRHLEGKRSNAAVHEALEDAAETDVET